MATFQQAIADFGRDMGIDGLAPGPLGGLQLRLETGAVLGIEEAGDEVVVHIAEPVRYDVAALVMKAMKKAGAPGPGEPVVQVGLRTTTEGDWLVVGTRVAEGEMSGRGLGVKVGQLREWVGRLEAG